MDNHRNHWRRDGGLPAHKLINAIRHDSDRQPESNGNIHRSSTSHDVRSRAGGGVEPRGTRGNDAGRSMKIEVPSRYIGKLIGRGGEHIKKLQRTTSCRIQVHDCTDNGTSTVVELTGSSDVQAHAKTLIENCVQGNGNRNGFSTSQHQRAGNHGSTECTVPQNGHQATAQSANPSDKSVRGKHTPKRSPSSERNKSRRTFSNNISDLNKYRVPVEELDSGDYTFRLELVASSPSDDKRHVIESGVHIPIICSMANSSGGRIDVVCPDGSFDTWLRDLRGQLLKYFKEAPYETCVKISSKHNLICIRVYRSKVFITTDTHMFKRVGSETCQVEGYREIMNIISLKASKMQQNTSSDDLIKGRKCSEVYEGRESETLELKAFESCSSLSELIRRIKNPRTRNTLLAMPNQIAGGRLIIGINNDRIVVGQKLLEEDQGLLIDELRKLLTENEDGTRPEWGDYSLEKYWQCDVHPVRQTTDLAERKESPRYDCHKGCADCPHPERRVLICITMFHCPGGVFAEQPEGFRLDDRGFVTRVPFEIWKTIHAQTSKREMFPELAINKTIGLFKAETPTNYLPSMEEIFTFLKEAGTQPCTLQRLEAMMKKVMNYEGNTLKAFAVADRELYSCMEDELDTSGDTLAGSRMSIQKPPSHLLDVLLLTESAEIFLFVICDTLGGPRQEALLSAYSMELARVSNKKIIECMESKDGMDSFRDVRIRCAVLSLDGREPIHGINESHDSNLSTEDQQRKYLRMTRALATVFSKPPTFLRDQIYRELDMIQLKNVISDDHRFNLIEGPPGCDTLHLALSACRMYGEETSLLLCPSKLICDHAQREGICHVRHVENSETLLNVLENAQNKWTNIMFLYSYNFSFTEDSYRAICKHTTETKGRHFWFFQESGYTNHRGSIDSFQEFYDFLKSRRLEYVKPKTMSIAKIRMSSMSVGSYISEAVLRSFGYSSDVECVSRVEGAGVHARRISDLSGEGLLEYLKALLAESLNSGHRRSHYAQCDIVILVDQERGDAEHNEVQRLKDLLAKDYPDIKIYPKEDFLIDSRMVILIVPAKDQHRLKEKLSDVKYQMSVACRAVDRLDILHESDLDVEGWMHCDQQTRSQVYDEQGNKKEIPHKASKPSSCSKGVYVSPPMSMHQTPKSRMGRDSDECCCSCCTSQESRLNIIESPPGCDKNVIAQNICKKFGKKCSAYISSSQGLVGRLNHSGDVDAFYARDAEAIIDLFHNSLQTKCCYVIDDSSKFEYNDHISRQICSFITEKNNRCLFVIGESPFQNVKNTETESLADFLIHNRHEYGSCSITTDSKICTNTQAIGSYMIDQITQAASEVSTELSCRNAEKGDGVFYYQPNTIHRDVEGNSIVTRVKQLLYNPDDEERTYNPDDIAIIFGKRQPDATRDEVKILRDLLRRSLPDVIVQGADVVPVSGIIVDELDNFIGLDSKVIIFVPNTSDEYNDMFDFKYRLAVVSRGTHRVEFVIPNNRLEQRLKQELYPAVEITSDNQRQLDDVIHKQCQRFNFIEGPPGSGKSLLALYVCEEYGRGNSAYISASTALNTRVKSSGFVDVYHATNVEDILRLLEEKLSNASCIVIDDYQHFVYSDSVLHELCTQIARDRKQLFVFEESEFQRYKSPVAAATFHDFILRNRHIYGSMLVITLTTNQTCTQAVGSFIKDQISEICSGAENEVNFPVRRPGSPVVIDHMPHLCAHCKDNALIGLVRQLLPSENESQHKKYDARDVAILVDSGEEHVSFFKQLFTEYLPETCTHAADVYPVTGVIIESLDNFSGLEARVVICILLNKIQEHGIHLQSLNNPRYRIALASKGIDCVYILQDDAIEEKTLPNMPDNTSQGRLPTSEAAQANEGHRRKRYPLVKTTSIQPDDNSKYPTPAILETDPQRDTRRRALAGKGEKNECPAVAPTPVEISEHPTFVFDLVQTPSNQSPLTIMNLMPDIVGPMNDPGICLIDDTHLLASPNMKDVKFFTNKEKRDQASFDSGICESTALAFDHDTKSTPEGDTYSTMRCKTCPGSSCGNTSRDKFTLEATDQELCLSCTVCGYNSQIADYNWQTRQVPTVNKTNIIGESIVPAMLTCHSFNGPENPVLVGRQVCGAELPLSQSYAKVEDVHNLVPGDHIMWQRYPSFCHHGIVIDVRFHPEQVKVISFIDNCVKEEWLNIDPQKYALYQHDFCHQADASNPDDVIARARTMADLNKYNFMTSNCEHFTRWCKTEPVSRAPRAKSHSPPPHPVIPPLLEMGFSMKHIKKAMNATGSSGEFTVNSVNSLATWMLEHPPDPEDSVPDIHHGNIRDLIHSDQSTPQTPDATRVPFVRERSESDLPEVDHPGMQELIVDVDELDAERDEERRERSMRRYGIRRQTANEIRRFFSLISRTTPDRRPETHSGITWQRGQTGNTIKTTSGITVQLKKSTITNEQVDVIVNTTKVQLDLSQGAVSSAILRAGGAIVQKECQEFGPKGITSGNTMRTSAGGIKKVKAIYHGVFTSWDGGNSKKELQILNKFIGNCLRDADSEGCQSIAFPAIGTGDLQFPADVVAEVMFQEFLKFGQQYPDTCLKDIRVILSARDVVTVQALENHLDKLSADVEEATGHQQRTIKKPAHKPQKPAWRGAKKETRDRELDVTVGPICLDVKKGDITEENIDAIVNSTNPQLDLSVDNVTPPATIPTMDIAHGLAWSYYYGYLSLVLPGIQERVREKDEIYENMFNKFIVLLPSSGFCAEDIKESDSNITSAGTIIFAVSRSANVKRDYKSAVLKLVDPETSEVHHVIMEYATPLWTLYEMEMGRIAGLGEKDKLEEVAEFNEMLSRILKQSRLCNNKYTLLSYNDCDARFQDDAHALSRLVTERIRGGTGTWQ